MEGIPLLKDIVILIAVSVPISIVLVRLGLPTIVGFLLTGVIIGPYGFGLVTDPAEVETLAQMGIVLLLFTIGLEFSVTRMLNIKREAMLGGGLQIGFTVLLVWLFATFLDQPFHVAVLLGFIVSLSSSAIVLKLLVDSGEVSSSHGNLSVGILLFQDLCVVLMVMVIEGMGGDAGVSGVELVKRLGMAVAAIAIIVVTVSYLAPKLFHVVVKLRNREVFILTIVLVCLGTAWLTSLVGLSLALGAFIAGLVVSESEYSNQIVAEVLPFRDTFSSLFFMSMGMLLELQFFVYHMPQLLLLAAAVLVVKALILIGVGRILNYPLRLSLMVGFNLAQIGEFSFILIKMGQDDGYLSQGLYQTLLAVSIITMAITPFIFKFSSSAAFRIAHKLGARASQKGIPKKTHLANHVIIVGYGLNGRNLARVLKETAIEHLVLDINFTRVAKAKKDGHRAYYGDASHPEILKKMAVERAKMVVFAITDPVSTRRGVTVARELNPALSIVVRTRYTGEVEELYRLGSDQVISEEFETSVEIFARVLRDYRLPANIIQNQIDLVRQEGYAMLRSPSLSGERLASLASILDTSVMDTFFIEKGCRVAGMTLEELDLRRKTGGTTVMAVIRNGKAHTNPRGEFKFAPGDMLVLLGAHGELNVALRILKEKCPTAEGGAGGKDETFWGRGE
ncbi:MAG: cation:proton antiporter [Thermodesulfobacteriota bacterium]